jgi:DNA primase
VQVDLFTGTGGFALRVRVNISLPAMDYAMGVDCSQKQAELIVSSVKPGGIVWIMPDGDKAGERHAQSLLTQISPHRLMRWLKIPEGKQPTDLSKEQLKLSFIN